MPAAKKAAKKKVAKKTNVEQLEAAGVLDSTTLRPSQVKKINQLTAAEVKHLKSTRGKVGSYSQQAHPAGRPWIL